MHSSNDAKGIKEISVTKLGLMAHVSNPGTWGLRQVDCSEFQAKLVLLHGSSGQPTVLRPRLRNELQWHLVPTVDSGWWPHLRVWPRVCRCDPL